MFSKIGILKNFALFTGKHLCWSLFWSLLRWLLLSCRVLCDLFIIGKRTHVTQLYYNSKKYINVFSKRNGVINDDRRDFSGFAIQIDFEQPNPAGFYLLVQSQQWKFQINLRNLFKVNNKRHHKDVQLFADVLPNKCPKNLS